jgi:3-oxoacyl-[acyl-carrier protein] reductase
MSRFQDKKAVVTGAGSGIGREVALKLAREGAVVALSWHVSREKAERLAQEIGTQGGEAFAFPLDQSKPEGVEVQLECAVRKLGRLDLLVNNAGEWMKKTPLIDCDDALWDRLLAVNLTSVFRLCRRAARIMRGQKSGAIVNVSSIVARTAGGGGSVPYCVAKAGVNTLTRGLARELADLGIRVNAVAPGLVDTAMLDENFDAQAKAGIAAAIPLRRMARPEELADAILFLASGAASYITGEILEVNGGALMD